ncbi:hypothetical protein MHBO_000961 [Bonamia ostreae]|uniref:Uncharacterized protein n=1 Tax=Bonamia ostreae TaxID=126728 RepID=A0ABV2AI31_9EUKA
MKLLKARGVEIKSLPSELSSCDSDSKKKKTVAESEQPVKQPEERKCLFKRIISKILRVPKNIISLAKS